MKVMCDPAKNAANIAKHGFSLQDAAGLEWEAAVVWLDSRRDYGEPRMVGLVPVNDRLFCVVFVDRSFEELTERRIISLRRANNREVQRYANDD